MATTMVVDGRAAPPHAAAAPGSGARAALPFEALLQQMESGWLAGGATHVPAVGAGTAPALPRPAVSEAAAPPATGDAAARPAAAGVDAPAKRASTHDRPANVAMPIGQTPWAAPLPPEVVSAAGGPPIGLEATRPATAGAPPGLRVAARPEQADAPLATPGPTPGPVPAAFATGRPPAPPGADAVDDPVATRAAPPLPAAAAAPRPASPLVLGGRDDALTLALWLPGLAPAEADSLARALRHEAHRQGRRVLDVHLNGHAQTAEPPAPTPAIPRET